MSVVLGHGQEFQKSRPNMQRAKKEQLRVLMDYDHIAFLWTGNNTLAGKNIEKLSGDESDAESEEDDHMKEIKNSDLVENGNGRENVNGGDEAFLADDVLASVIKQGGGIVSYVFQKFD